jgi:Zn-dependent metalloprotease
MQTVVSKGRSNQVLRLHGNMIQGSPGDIAGIPASLDPLGALKKMKNRHKEKNASETWHFTDENYGTYIYFTNGKAHLCYVVSFLADTEYGNPTEPVFFIDVKSGKVIYRFNGLKSAVGTGPGGNLKTGYYHYGTDYPGFGVTESGTNCIMESSDVRTVDLNHGTSGNTTFSYPCYENTHKEINGAYCPLNDAQYFGQVVYDLYKNWYGISPLPFKLTLKCHYGVNHENAYWLDNSMVFGDGADFFHPCVSLDVVSHEICHGFIIFNSDLTLDRKSGGINEAFCDMAGEAAKYYMKGTNDFMFAYDIFKAPGGALRYMYDPPLDGISIDHVKDYNNKLNFHDSAGIFNKAFYLLATTPGWTTRKAFDIFVKANLDYWTPGTNFQQGAEAALNAAFDYGYPCQDVVNAFAVVGITLTCSGPHGEIYVKDITQSIKNAGNNYSSDTSVAIWAANDEPAAEATVTITWSGVVNGSASGITGADGIVTFKSKNVRANGPFVITVTDVTHGTLSYNSSLNNETSDSATF